jgi:tetratricopeptide (TPR) repeat protein
VERRLAVHAGALALIAALATTAAAAPKKHAAKVQFQKGVAAYQKGDFDGASAAFERSFKLEADQETLFAWAQSERKLEHCEHAVELYQKLLAMKLPAENRSVIEQQIGECKPPPPPAAEAPPTPAPAPLPQVHDDSPLAQPHAIELHRTNGLEDQPDIGTLHSRPWYRDPVGDSLAVAGVAGLAVGGTFLLLGHSADSTAKSAMTYQGFVSNENTAHSRGETGVIALTAGVAFVATAAVWYWMKD